VTDLAHHPTVVATLRLAGGLGSPLVLVLVLVLAPAARSAFWKSDSVNP
jgi:hypothetical protein